MGIPGDAITWSQCFFHAHAVPMGHDPYTRNPHSHFGANGRSQLHCWVTFVIVVEPQEQGLESPLKWVVRLRASLMPFCRWPC